MGLVTSFIHYHSTKVSTLLAHICLTNIFQMLLDHQFHLYSELQEHWMGSHHRRVGMLCQFVILILSLRH